MSSHDPDHYKVGGIESIDVIRAKLSPEQFEGFCLGNAMKYVHRAGHKGSKADDIKKAVVYLGWAGETETEPKAWEIVKGGPESDGEFPFRVMCNGRHVDDFSERKHAERWILQEKAKEHNTMSNTIHMQCRLGKDPETRDVGDTTVTRLWVAESEKFKRKDGEQVEHTNWWSCEVWGKSGETVARFFNKGDGIVITGNLKITEKDDNKYYSIRVNQWEFPMSKKGDGDSSPAAKASGVADSPSDDNIPF